MSHSSPVDGHNVDASTPLTPRSNSLFFFFNLTISIKCMLYFLARLSLVKMKDTQLKRDDHVPSCAHTAPHLSGHPALGKPINHCRCGTAVTVTSGHSLMNRERLASQLLKWHLANPRDPPAPLSHVTEFTFSRETSR